MKSKSKTVTVLITGVRSDQWVKVVHELGLVAADRVKFFHYDEYANLELEIDEDLRVVGGRLIPVERRGRN